MRSRVSVSSAQLRSTQLVHYALIELFACAGSEGAPYSAVTSASAPPTRTATPSTEGWTLDESSVETIWLADPRASSIDAVQSLEHDSGRTFASPSR